MVDSDAWNNQKPTDKEEERTTSNEGDKSKGDSPGNHRSPRKVASMMSLTLGKITGREVDGAERDAKAVPEPQRARGMHRLSLRKNSRAQEPSPISTSPSESTTTASKKSSETSVPRFNEWSAVKLLEQYDPTDLTTVSQPYAYVGDYVTEVKLGVSISDEMAAYEAQVRSGFGTPSSESGTPARLSVYNGLPISSGESSNPPVTSTLEIKRRERRAGWLAKLRDHLQKDAEIGWFVVVCGDEDRSFPESDEEEVVNTGTIPPKPNTLKKLVPSKKRNGVD